jgi:hypothetical protein
VAGSIPPLGYLVVGDSGVPADIAITTALQNDNEAVALLHEDSCLLIDAFAYEGAVGGLAISCGAIDTTLDFVEGTLATDSDSNAVQGSLSRLPNGSDTDDAASDWSFTTSVTPGAANM